jgi:hypothetical protein
MSKSMSRPNIAAPGEAFNAVWYVEQIAHAALSMNCQCQQVQLNQPCQVQRCASWFLGPDGRAHKWHLLVDS